MCKVQNRVSALLLSKPRQYVVFFSSSSICDSQLLLWRNHFWTPLLLPYITERAALEPTRSLNLSDLIILPLNRGQLMPYFVCAIWPRVATTWNAECSSVEEPSARWCTDWPENMPVDASAVMYRFWSDPDGQKHRAAVDNDDSSSSTHVGLRKGDHRRLLWTSLSKKKKLYMYLHF